MAVVSHVADEGDNRYWTKSARLFFNSIGEINLRDQSTELRVVIHSAIHKITSWIIFKDSFPTVMTRAIWNREALLAAANEFVEASREGPLKENYRAIQERCNNTTEATLGATSEVRAERVRRHAGVLAQPRSHSLGGRRLYNDLTMTVYV